MIIDIHERETEALIERRMATGRYKTLEEMVRQTLEAGDAEMGEVSVSSGGTGAEIVAAMQACPVKGFEFEGLRSQLPVSDPLRF